MNENKKSPDHRPRLQSDSSKYLLKLMSAHCSNFLLRCFRPNQPPPTSAVAEINFDFAWCHWGAADISLPSSVMNWSTLIEVGYFCISRGAADAAGFVADFRPPSGRRWSGAGWRELGPIS
jgi:hypothetical protein